MGFIEKEIKKYKSLELITLAEFYKSWEFDKNTKIALIEEGEELPIYSGFAYQVPIIFADRRILRFTYPEEKTPIIYLFKEDEQIDNSTGLLSLWRSWCKDKKLYFIKGGK